MTTTMKLHVQHLNIRSIHALDAWVEEQLLALGRARPIDEANVRLARRLDASPAYQVNVHLVTPGPDVFVESRDHTLRAAFAKAMAQLRAQIISRTTKRLQRLKSSLRGRCGRLNEGNPGRGLPPASTRKLRARRAPVKNL